MKFLALLLTSGFCEPQTSENSLFGPNTAQFWTLLLLAVGPKPRTAAHGSQTSPCPRECICLSQTQVLCNTGGLLEVPLKTLPPTVEQLSLTKNTFPIIKTDAFTGLRNLRKLSLDANNITTIKPFAFRGLPKLRELSIQNTPLSLISQFAFAGLQNISTILLGNNRITRVEGYSFVGTANVRLILLHNNPIHRIDSRAFSGLRNVDHLILPSGIRLIEPEAFAELDYVGILKLAFMDLKGLKPHTFRGLTHVQVLAITDSDLGVIGPDVFDGMAYINSLHLINNKIDAVQQLFIRKANHVKILRLHGNHLLQTPHRSAISIEGVETISVLKNHFPCDCHLHSLLTSQLVNNSAEFRSSNFCISPLGLNGKALSYVDLDSVGYCPEPEHRGDASTPHSTNALSGRSSYFTSGLLMPLLLGVLIQS